MKISVIISLAGNRAGLFKRSLDAWLNQTLPKSEWEMIVVDDANRLGCQKLCRRYARKGIQMRFLRVDRSRSLMPVRGFVPALTINAGIKAAQGRVLMITGPEVIHGRGNLSAAAEADGARYGMVAHAGRIATGYLAKGWSSLQHKPIRHLAQLPTVRLHKAKLPNRWSCAVVLKNDAERIGGVDERFLGGDGVDDADFAGRLHMAGVEMLCDTRIVCLHQDHSMDDARDPSRQIDPDERQKLRDHNFTLLKDALDRNDPVANKSEPWGALGVPVTLEEQSE